jgi:hypothetical protein
MKKQILIVGIVIILLIVGLSGCQENTSKSDEDRIIGAWIVSELFQGSTRNISIIFLSNKTFETVGTYKGETNIGSGTWRIVNDKLEIDITEPKVNKSINDYNFSNNFNTLTITDSTGITMDFTKQ